MIHVRCKDGMRGALVVNGRLIRATPGWTGYVPRSVLLVVNFLESCDPPSTPEVRQSEDPFR